MSIRMSAVTRMASSMFLAGLLGCLSSFALAQPSNVTDLTGEWRIIGNGYPGELVVSKQNGASFSGKVYNERMIDGTIVGKTIRFTRMWDTGKLRQDFIGELMIGANGKGTITGTFTQNHKGSYQWTATSVDPLRRTSSTPAPSGASQPSATPGKTLPIDVSGSWSFKGDRNQVGRVNIWQNGQHFTVITSWPSNNADHKAGIWKSYKGEGIFQGRQMVFKVMPSNRDGRSADEGWVYHWTISDDNSRITGYYTRHGKKTTDHKFDYYKVK